MNDVTQLLGRIGQGDGQAAAELLPLVYDELRKLAAARLAREKAGQTLQPTALVHEAYVRLVGAEPDKPWDGRGHFFAAAAEAMRRILVENARHKRRLRHGGDRDREPLDEQALAAPVPEAALLDLDAALTDLEARNPRQAQVVKLRYFAGMTVEETAGVLGVSTATVDRDWTFARAWLYREVSRER